MEQMEIMHRISAIGSRFQLVSGRVTTAHAAMLCLRSRLPSFLSCLEAVFLGGERNFCNIHFSSLFCLRRGNGFPLSLSLFGRFSRPPESINKDRVWKEGRARGLRSRADRGSRYQNNEEGMRILGETDSYLIQF